MTEKDLLIQDMRRELTERDKGCWFCEKANEIIGEFNAVGEGFSRIMSGDALYCPLCGKKL